MAEARQDVAELIRAEDPDEIVFLNNATTGIFTVLYNQTFEEGDVVINLSTTYGATNHALTSLAENRQFLRVECVEFEFPTSSQDIVSRFAATIAKVKALGLRPKIALLETVVSIPAMRMPFEQLLEICRGEKVMSLVDGAHSVGQFRINMGALQPDFFVADLHKYVLMHRGGAHGFLITFFLLENDIVS